MKNKFSTLLLMVFATMLVSSCKVLNRAAVRHVPVSSVAVPEGYVNNVGQSQQLDELTKSSNVNQGDSLLQPHTVQLTQADEQGIGNKVDDAGESISTDDSLDQTSNSQGLGTQNQSASSARKPNKKNNFSFVPSHVTNKSTNATLGQPSSSANQLKKKSLSSKSSHPDSTPATDQKTVSTQDVDESLKESKVDEQHEDKDILSSDANNANQDSVVNSKQSAALVTDLFDGADVNEVAEESAEDNPMLMKILLIALLLIIVLFVAYIVYSRNVMARMKEHEREQLFNLRMQHSQEADRRSELKSLAQGKADKMLLDLKREKEEALSEKTKAIEAKNEALAAQQEALGARDEALASLAARDEALEAKDAEIRTQKEALAAKDAELASQKEILEAKDAELSAKTAALSAATAELQATRDELAVANAASPTVVEKIVEKIVEVPVPAVSEGNIDAALTSTDHTQEINAMRKFLIRKIESAQAVLDLKGQKKGDVLTSEELKDIEVFLNEADDNFVTRISEKFPELTRKDIELLMLLRLRLPSKNLASVYGINEKSIKQKLFVYKAKIGLETDPMSLRDFVEQF